MNASNGPDQTRQRPATPGRRTQDNKNATPAQTHQRPATPGRRNQDKRIATPEEIKIINKYLSEELALRVFETTFPGEKSMFISFLTNLIAEANKSKMFIKENSFYKCVVCNNVAYNIFTNGAVISISLCVQPTSTFYVQPVDMEENKKVAETDMNRNNVQNDSANYNPYVQKRTPSAPRMRQKACYHGLQCHGYKNGNCPYFHGNVDQPVNVFLGKNLAETSIQNLSSGERIMEALVSESDTSAVCPPHR
jgi:hypothetical protein